MIMLSLGAQKNGIPALDIIRKTMAQKDREKHGARRKPTTAPADRSMATAWGSQPRREGTV